MSSYFPLKARGRQRERQCGFVSLYLFDNDTDDITRVMLFSSNQSGELWNMLFAVCLCSCEHIVLDFYITVCLTENVKAADPRVQSSISEYGH